MSSGHRLPIALILLLTLLTSSLPHLQAASGRSLPARFSRDQLRGGAVHPSLKRPTLLTFHGFVEDAQGRQPIILHVLIKAKRLPDGSFSVRAVSYAERAYLQSEWQRFNRICDLQGHPDRNHACMTSSTFRLLVDIRHRQVL